MSERYHTLLVFILFGVFPHVVLSNAQTKPVCGNGLIEALGPGQANCNGIVSSSEVTSAMITPEKCDMKSAAMHGHGTGACATTCQPERDSVQKKLSFEKPTASSDFARALMTNAPQVDTSDYVRMCMYSTQLVDANCAPVVDYGDAAGCFISGEDFRTHKALRCYQSDGNDYTYHLQNGLCITGDTQTGMSISQLELVGKMTADTSIVDYHKCIPRLMTTGHAMVTAPESHEHINVTESPGGFGTRIVHKTGDKFPRMYDVCFGFHEPAYATVAEDSKMYQPRRQKVSYTLICDPLDQLELVHCDSSDIGQCSTFGQVVNPCQLETKPWTLMLCEVVNGEETCKALTDTEVEAQEYDNRYGVDQHYGSAIGKGTKFEFDHDMQHNPFQCQENTFDNNQLSGSSQYDSFTEVANTLNTCAHSPESRSIPGMQQSGLSDELTSYRTGCQKRLKIQMDQGWGAIYLRVEFTVKASHANDGEYASKHTEMLGFQIQATVNNTSAQQISITNKYLSEAGVDATSGKTDMWPGNNPFGDWKVRGRDSSWEEVGLFSPTSKVNVEYIDCTESTGFVSVDRNNGNMSTHLNVARFSITDTSTNGIFAYHAATRSYEEYNAAEANHGDIHYWQHTDNQLAVRSLADQIRTNIYTNGGIPWHTVYTNGTLSAPGICLKMRLTVYEPSSCSSHTIVTAPSTVQVTPEQISASTGGALIVASKQQKHIWKEDEHIPLLVDVGYDKLDEDSALFYFSHITIEDMGKGQETEHFAGDFDLFLYSETAVAPHGYTDAIGRPKITRGFSNNIWTAYSNPATMFLHRNPTESFGSTGLHEFLAEFDTDPCGESGEMARDAACLAHARTRGQGLFGNTSVSALRTGIYMRHRKGSSTNVKMNITIWSIDGAAHNATSGATVAYDTTSQIVEFANTPRGNVRMDQGESCASTASLRENEMVTAQTCGGKMHIPTTKRSNYTDSGGIYRDVQLCTYTHQNGSLTDTWATPDSVFANGEDLYDTLCDKDSKGLDSDGNVFYSSVNGSRYITRDCPHIAGYRLTCETPSNNKFTESRIKFNDFIVFDESTISHMPGTNTPYQPAGSNENANDTQWYRVEPCASSTEFTKITWCNQTNAVAVNTLGLPSHVTHEHSNGDCALLPGAYDESFSSDTQPFVNSNVQTQNSNAAGLQANFWKANIGTDTRAVEGQSLCIRGLSSFNTQKTEASPVSLRIMYSVRDTLTVPGSDRPYHAYSVTNAPDGEMVVEFISVRSTAMSLVKPGGTYSVVERPSTSRYPVGTWQHSGVSLLPSIDCSGTKSATKFCMDRLRFQETSEFQDQYMGRMEIECKVRSHLHPEWESAGGLFDVFVTELSSLIADTTSVTQYEGFLNGRQDVNSANTTGARGSQCVLQKDSSIRGTVCSFATNPHTFDTYGAYREVFYNQTTVRSTVPLRAREWQPKVDLAFPYHWNDVQFKCEITASNEDREHLPDLCLSHNTVWDHNDHNCAAKQHASETQTVIISINSTSTNPYMFIEINPSSNDAACTGYSAMAGCASSGVRGQEEHEYRTPEDYGTSMAWNVNPGPNAILEMTAGRIKKLRLVAGSYNTDNEADFHNPPDGAEQHINPDLAPWTPMQAQLNATGERVYLTIESKRGNLQQMSDPGPDKVPFCVWACPLDKPNCKAEELQRFKPFVSGIDSVLDPNLSNSGEFDCPYAVDATHGKNAGTKYSIACATEGRCHELEDLYLSYPQHERFDDLLEFIASERGDYRGVQIGRAHV